MIYEYSLSKFMDEFKSNYSLDTFIDKFYRNVKLNNYKYEDYQYDELLIELYYLSDKEYIEWYKTLKKIPYFFARNNTELILKLVRSKNHELMSVAYEMEKRKRSIVSRCLPMKATTCTVTESKEKLLTSLYMQAALLDSLEDDNPIRKGEASFALSFGDYENNEYLGEFYTKTIESLDEEIRNTIDTEIRKVGGISEALVQKQGLDIFHEDMNHLMRYRRTPIVYKRKNR